MAGRFEAKRLIVNADDLALHPAINRAIFKAHREGIVTSSTMLVGGSAFIEAVEEAKSHPNLGIGIHLCLVDQKPVSRPDEIPSLVAEDGLLPKTHLAFLKRALAGRIKLDEVQGELNAQVAKALDAGLKPTHLDSHQHLHIFPQIVPLVAEIGKKYNIKRIRVPYDYPAYILKSRSLRRRLEGAIVAILARRSNRIFARNGISSTDYFFGFARGGDFSKDTWVNFLPKVLSGVTEIMVHPGENNVILKSDTGWDYHWEEELSALTDSEIRDIIEKHDIQLTHFGKIN